MTITWSDRLASLRKALGRDPTPQEMLDAAQVHQLTPAEIEEQAKSWARGMSARCEHGELDFEQCPECRKRRDLGKDAG